MRPPGPSRIEQLKVGGMANFAYLIVDRETSQGAVIDPSSGGSQLLRLARSSGVKVTRVLLTHCHHDHTMDAAMIRSETGAALAAHESCGPDLDIALGDGDIVDVGALRISVIYTPGHTPDSVCYRLDDALFTGDTLFVGECGRTDLPGSDVRMMHHSLLTVIRCLPDSLVIYPGHDYGRTPTSTLGHEKAHNYTLEPRSLEEFIRFMNEP